jgi:hypothetical protein
VDRLNHHLGNLLSSCPHHCDRHSSCIHDGRRRVNQAIAFKTQEQTLTNRKFISHCGPGEWVVCNCITEGDDYLPYNPTPDELESLEAEELLDPSDSASKPEE